MQRDLLSSDSAAPSATTTVDPASSSMGAPLELAIDSSPVTPLQVPNLRTTEVGYDSRSFLRNSFNCVVAGLFISYTTFPL